MTFKPPLCLAILCLSVVPLSAPLKADVLYRYTGANYNAFTPGSPYTPQENLTVSFTVPDALAPLTEYMFSTPGPGPLMENPTLLSWSSFDGVYSISSTNLPSTPIITGFVKTNARGHIYRWELTVGRTNQPDGVSVSAASCSASPGVVCESIFEPMPPFDFVETIVDDRPFDAASSNVQGSWSEVPEPDFDGSRGRHRLASMETP
jgi:hypothetical protein